MRLWLLVLLAGCDGVFNLDHVPVHDGGAHVDARPNCTLDTFSGGLNGLLANWTRTMESPGVDLIIDADQVDVRVAAGALGYAFVQRNTKVDMTGATATVELDAYLGVKADTYFSLTLDMANFYFFNVNDGELAMQVRELGVDRQNITIPYNFPDYRWLRLQHDPAQGRIKFLTSLDGSDDSWTERHSVTTANVAIDALRPELGAGAYQVAAANPREARFDNFEFCLPP